MGEIDYASAINWGSDSPGGNRPSPTAGTITAPIIRLAYVTAAFSLTFIASCVTAYIATPIDNSDATSSVSVETRATTYYVNLASATNGTAGVISNTIQATAAGTLGVIEDQLRITSNTPDGYSLYISMANDDNGQRLVNTERRSYYFSAIDPETYDLTNPGTLSQPNSWGVAVANSLNSNFSSASEYSDEGVTLTTKFAPVPKYGDEQLLLRRTGNTVQTGGTVDTISVYYGYHANSSLPSGTYQNMVLYTAYAEGDDPGSTSVFSGDIDYKNGGTATFTTSLYTNQEVNIEDAVVTITDGNITKNCEVTEVTKAISGENETVVVTCTAPSVSRPGNYVAHISIENFGHESSATIFYDTDGITIGNNDPIKTMQGMTESVCRQWKQTPRAFTSGNSPVYKYGANLSVADFMNDRQAAAAWDDVVATAAVTSGPAITNIYTNVPETYLRDSRDGNFYLIRKLADGNCWMTENLRYTYDEDDEDQAGTITTTGSDTYYDWSAASAGSVANSDNTASASICPTGWQLPEYSTRSRKSFYYLVMNVYGYDSRARTSTVSSGDAGSEGTYYQTVKGAHIYGMSQTLRQAPVSIDFAGYYSSTNAGIIDEDAAAFWTNTVSSDGTSAYAFRIAESALQFDEKRSKEDRLPIRCISK